MDVIGKGLCVYLDDRNIELLDAWAKDSKVSRSEAVRLILGDFFSREADEIAK